MPEHDTYVRVRTDDDGSQLAAAVCEDCGPLCLEMYLDASETVLRRIASEHWVQALAREHP